MNKIIRSSYVDSVKEITVIEVMSIRGAGTPDDPVEAITEYFLPDGKRLFRIDAKSRKLSAFNDEE